MGDLFASPKLFSFSISKHFKLVSSFIEANEIIQVIFAFKNFENYTDFITLIGNQLVGAWNLTFEVITDMHCQYQDVFHFCSFNFWKHWNICFSVFIKE